MHSDHRERVRRRIRAEGTDSFEEHQLLEALLFYSIPRVDTNETAHRLIERFGSLAKVFEAESEELKSVEGVGDNSAVLLKLVAGIHRKIALSGNERQSNYDSVGKIGRYLINMYFGITVERVLLMMFDNSMKLIDCAHICDGTVNEAVMLPRIMVEKALFKHAAAVVVAHNHPSGIAVPSGDDIKTTETLRTAFDLLGIQMLEHLVVAGRNYSAIMRLRNLGNGDASIPVVGRSMIKLDDFYKDLPPAVVTDVPPERADTLKKL